MKEILIFLVIFGLLVFVHEFGHFIVAQKSGILVREFSIGMGPKLFQKKGKRTTYTIRWLPLGGYVRLAGPDEVASLDPGETVVLQFDKQGRVSRIDASSSQVRISGLAVRVIKADLVDQLEITGNQNGDEDEPKLFKVSHDASIIEKNGTEVLIAPRDTQFQEASLGKKIATNFAGPFMNILLGFLVFLIWSFAAPGPSTTTIARVIPGTPAATSGFKSGDRVVTLAGKRITYFDQISTQLSKIKGKSVSVGIERNKRQLQFNVKPAKKKNQGQTIYQLGIYAQSDNRLGVKWNRGWQTAWSTTILIFSAVGRLFRHFSLNDLSGPVGIYSQTAQVAQMGLTSILAFLAMISINLGIVNLLPIPGLDGGKLLLNLIELIFRRKIPEDKEVIVNLVGFGLLMLLLILVTGNDIYRYFIK